MQGYSQAQLDATYEAHIDRVIGIENSGIINGPQYKMDFIGASSHPFFLNGEVNGVIRFQNQLYEVPLLYDIYKQQIIVKHLSLSGNGWLIQLDKGSVQEFSLANHLFRNINGQFYEVVFEGDELTILANRSKIQSVRNRIFNYVQNDDFFMVQSGQFKFLRNKSDLIDILLKKEDQSALKEFLKKDNIRLKRFQQGDLIKVGNFVNQLLRAEIK